MMDKFIEFFFITLILLGLIFSVFFNVMKIKLWEYIREKLQEQDRYNDLVRSIKESKKNKKER